MNDYLIVAYIEIIAAWRYSIPVLLVVMLFSLSRKRKIVSAVLMLLLVLLSLAAYQFETFK